MKNLFNAHIKTTITVLLCMFTQFAFSQKLNCENYKTGKFLNIDDNSGNTLIERDESFQIETNKESGIKVKLKITWLSSCTYRLSFVSGNSKWNATNQGKKFPDLMVEIVETGDNYYIQVSKFEGINDLEYKSKMKRVKQ